MKPYLLGIYNLLGEKVYSASGKIGTIGGNIYKKQIQDYKQKSIKLVLTK